MAISWSENQCSFVKNDDIVSGMLNIPMLMEEINDAITSATVDYVNTEEDVVTGKINVTVFFDVEPTSGDKTIVEGIIANHSGIQSTTLPIKYQNIAEQSNDTTNWVQVGSLTTPPLRTGAWQADISAELKTATSSLASGAQLRMMVAKQGDSLSEKASFVHNLAVYSGSSARIPFTSQEGDVWEIEFDLRKAGGESNTAYVQRLRMSLTYDGQNFYS